MIKKIIILSSILAGISLQAVVAESYYSVITKTNSNYDVLNYKLSTSCNDILENGLSTGDGNYEITYENRGTLEVYCDMTTDGGGWTRLERTMLANNNFFELDFTVYSGFTPYFQSGYLVVGDQTSAGSSDARVDLTLPFEYNQFYLKDYQARQKLNIIDIGQDFSSIIWSQAITSDAWGDILFGSINDDKPVTSYVKEGVYEQYSTNQNILFPNDNIYSLNNQSDIFSIRAIEGGGEDEDFFLWYSGYVFVR